MLQDARHPQRVTCSHVAVDFEGLRPQGLHLEDAAALLPGQEELLAVLWELCRKKEKVSEKTSLCPMSPSCCQHDPSRRSPLQEPATYGCGVGCVLEPAALGSPAFQRQ